MAVLKMLLLADWARMLLLLLLLLLLQLLFVGVVDDVTGGALSATESVSYSDVGQWMFSMES